MSDAYVADDPLAGVTIEIAGTVVVAHPDGILYLADAETLVVADLHLEKGSSFARKNVFLPPYDTAETLRVLTRLVRHFKPRCVIALGDSFHDEEGPDRLPPGERADLSALVRTSEWIWISGNHDPVLPKSLGGNFAEEWALGNLTFRHEPSPDPYKAHGEIAGHLHPSARVRGRGRSVRKRCFVTDGKRLIMPAFGALTGGLNVRDDAFRSCFPEGRFHAYMMGNDRLYPIAARACLP